MARTVIPSQSGSDLLGGSPPLAADGIPEKLVKYVPAETLAFFVPIAAAIDSDHRRLLIIVSLVALFGTPGYLWQTARSLPPEKRPLFHFYPLAMLAFACWAIATAPNLAALLRLDDITAGVILGLAVFLIPLADGVLDSLHGKR